MPLPRELRMCTLISFVVALGFGVIAPALPLLAKEYGVGNATVGTAISAMALMRFATAIVNSRFVQRFGERRVLTLGLVVQAVTTIAAGLAPSFTLLIVFRALGGIGSSAFTIAALAMVLRLAPSESRGRAVGVYQAGFMMGAIAGPGVGGFLADVNARLPFILYGVLLFVAGGIGHFMLKPRPLPTSTGLVLLEEPDGMPSHAFGAVQASGSMSQEDPDETRGREVYIRALAAALIVNFGTGWLFYGVRNSIIPMFATTKLGGSGTFVGVTLLSTAVTQAIFVRMFGRWGDRRGRRAVMMSSTFLGAASVALLCLPSDNSIFVISMVCIGLAGGGLSSAPVAVLADISQRNTASNVAWFNMSADFGAIIGPIAAGLVADAFSFQAAFVLTAAILAAGLISSVAMKETLSRPRPDSAPAIPLLQQ